MSEWKPRWDKELSLEEIVEKNTGCPIQELKSPPVDPEIRNLDEAVAFVKDFLDRGEPVKVMADYDCDGVMSGTILYLAIRAYSGRDIPVRFPKRFSEGYGLSMNVVNETDAGLIITVDNGIAAVDQIKAAKEKGLSVVILDHHLMRADGLIPDADVIVDPHVYNGGFDEYCGAGLALRFAKKLVPDKNGLYTKLTAFAGIATVADVMKLIGDNRRMVRNSLDAVRNRNVTVGMDALLDALNVEHVEADDYGFLLGPVVNAAGRLDDDGPHKVFSLISIDEGNKEALMFQAAELVEYNNTRRDLVYTFTDRAKKMADEGSIKEKHQVAIFYSDDFHEGINGIIAGQMAEELKMPCIVLSPGKKEGLLKGSGRSYGEINLIRLLNTASDCFAGYGGHEGAAGLTVIKDKLEELQKRLDETMLTEEFASKAGLQDDVILYDKEINIKDVPYFISELEELGPFGEGNPKPVFRIDGFELTPKNGKYFRVMGRYGNHVKLFGDDISAVAFGMIDRFSGELPAAIDIVGTIYANIFNGKTENQIEVVDFIPVEKKKTEAYDLFAGLLDFR